MPPGGTDFVRQQYDQLAKKYDQRWRHYITATVEETLRRLRLGPAQS